jgi:hypothetical protein
MSYHNAEVAVCPSYAGDASNSGHETRLTTCSALRPQGYTFSRLHGCASTRHRTVACLCSIETLDRVVAEPARGFFQPQCVCRPSPRTVGPAVGTHRPCEGVAVFLIDR